MMSGDNFTEEISQSRVALGDRTNRPVKREYSSVSDDLGLKSGNGRGKKLACENGNIHFAKQVCLGINNSVNKKSKLGGDNSDPMSAKQTCNSSPSDSDIETSQVNTVSVILYGPDENKETSNLLDDSGNVKSVGEGWDASRDSCASTGSMPTNSSSFKKESDDDGRLSSDVNQNNHVDNFGTSVDKDVCKYGSVEWSRLPEPQCSRSFELDRCTALKGDCFDNLSAGADLLKACSCSFCLKAAYIWSDLHYQDIKGRIAALKKSKKEASILVNKYARGDQTDIHSRGNSKFSKLESDLTAQWRSLFQHMEDVFVYESNQLESSFVALKDLRENCKMDLERTTRMPSDKY